MRTIQPEIMIFSVFQSSRPITSNIVEHNATIMQLKGLKIPYLELEGYYKGIGKKSILVQGFEHRQIVEDFVKVHNQEYYLESHNDRISYLVCPDGTKTLMGKLVNVSKIEALKEDNYSYNPVTNEYFITRF